MQIDGVKFIFSGKISDDAYDVIYENDEITSITKSEKFNNKYIALPYADIHIHGAMGHDVSELNSDALNSVATYLQSNGIGYFCPTFVATPLEQLAVKFNKLRALKNNIEGAKIIGAHIEGPYISVAKKGAQPIENIFTSYDETDSKFFKKYSDVLRVVTLCPHTKNADILTKTLVENNIKVEAGHDDSVDDEIIKCMEMGLDGVTHLYCASSGIRRIDGKIEKHLGLNECALLFNNLFVEVILDNIHISPLLFKLIYKSKGFKNIILVSDSLSPTGAPLGEYLLGDSTKITSDGNVAYLSDKSTLAGSVTSVAKMVENAIALGVPIAEAVYMASESPLKYLNFNYDKIGIRSKHFNVIDERGKIIKSY